MTMVFSRRLLSVLVIPMLVAALTLASVATSPASLNAQGLGSVELVAQTSWIDDGGIFNLQVRVAGASPDSTVVLRVYEPWLERDDFLTRDLANNSSVLLELEPVLLGEAQQTSNEVLGFEILIDGPNTRTELPAVEPPVTPDDTATPDDAVTSEDIPDGEPFEEDPIIPALITDGRAAIFPVEVALLDAEGTTTDSFLTSIIELPRRDLRPPLNVAMIFEPTGQQATLPNLPITVSSDVVRDLAILNNMIAQHPDTNVSLSISPETLIEINGDQRAEVVAIVDGFQDNLSPEQLLPHPLTPVEEQAWIEVGLVDDLEDLYTAGDDAVSSVLGIEPERSVMFLDQTVDGDSLDEMAELGVQGLIVRPSQIAPLDRSVFPEALTTRFLVNLDQQSRNDNAPDTIPALVADAGLQSHFTDPDGAVLNANRLLADLVLLSLQESAGRPSVVVAPPSTWRPDSNFLNVLLGGIERVPALEAVTPLDALANSEITPSLGVGTLSGPLRRDLTPPIQAASLRSFRTEYSQARNAIESWATVIGDDNVSRSRLDRLLHLSTDHRLTEADRNSYIEAVFAVIDDQKDTAITTPASETITLTGRESVVPIVVENTLDSNATVLMLLSSEELDFRDSAEIVRSLEPGANRIEIPITARASGDSPIRIQVLSPDGLILLGSTEVLVRTFAFSGLGIAIGTVAILVLLVWWVRHVRESRDNVDTLSEVIGV